MAEFKPNLPSADAEYGSPNNSPAGSQYRSPNGLKGVAGTGYGSPNGVAAEYSSPNMLDTFDETNWIRIWAPADGLNESTVNDAPITVGVRFKTTVPGVIVGILFSSATDYPQSYKLSLWSNTGTKLATVDTYIQNVGWAGAYFATPVPILANTLYVATAYLSAGRHPVTKHGYNNAHVTGVIQGIANGDGGINGASSLAATETFPTTEVKENNYWVDVGFIAN